MNEPKMESAAEGTRRSSGEAQLPSLPYESWAATKDTLHLWLQVVGKIKLAYMPPKNHWWHVTLHPDVRGMTTRRIPVDSTRRFQIAFDLIAHCVNITTSWGAEERLELRDGLSVATFDKELHAALARLGVDVAIDEKPFGVAYLKTPFAEDEEHASYDAAAVTRFWRMLDWTETVFDTFSGWFCGKTSPIQVFWHSFDLAFARFSGEVAPPMPDADPVTQEAYSHELIAFGFWGGDPNMPEPSYYSYTAPEPDGLRDKPLAAPAKWIEQNGGSLALLSYEAVRLSPDPAATLTAFLQGAYEAGGEAAGWDMAALESSWCPSPGRVG